jgi:hypothetical protein
LSAGFSEADPEKLIISDEVEAGNEAGDSKRSIGQNGKRSD